jgi:hypothetical protein
MVANRLSESMSLLVLPLLLGHRLRNIRSQAGDLQTISTQSIGLVRIRQRPPHPLSLEMLVTAFDQGIGQSTNQDLSSTMAPHLLVLDKLERFVQATIVQSTLDLSNS